MQGSKKPNALFRKPLSALLPGALAPVLKERGIATTALLTEWSEIAGPMIAKIATPLEIRWPKRNPEASAKGSRTARMEKSEKATLVLAASGAFALEIQMAGARIIEAANRRLGFSAIGRIELRQQPAPLREKRTEPPADDPALMKSFEQEGGAIIDPDLRKALARMGARITQKSTRHRS